MEAAEMRKTRLYCCSGICTGNDHDVSLEGTEIKNTLVITFAFFLVFTAFVALQNLHSSLHDEENLGFICLSVLYWASMVSSIFAPTILGLLGAKTVLLASFLAHCTYILTNFFPQFATMVPGAIALGAFHGPAMTAQALYISACAFSFSKTSKATPYSVLSRLNGLFFAVFASTQIVGNLVTSIVIRDGVSNSSEMHIFARCGADDCPLEENSTTIVDPSDWVIDVTLGVFMACSLSGFLLVFFLLTPLPRSSWSHKVSLRRTSTSCLNTLFSTNMILLVPFIIFSSMEHAFLLGTFTKSYVSCSIGIHMVGFVMAAYGGTAPIFTVIFSRLAKLTGRFILILSSMTVHLGLLVVCFLWTPAIDVQAPLFVVPIIWGIAESILQTQANSLIAIMFPGQKEPAFANFHAWRSFGYAVSFMNATYMCVSLKLIICMVICVAGIILYIVVEIKTKVRERLEMISKTSFSIDIELEDQTEKNKSNDDSSNKGRKISTAMLTSVQDRLSFDRWELTDIINEAREGWNRNEDGVITLEVNKIMSKAHLFESKVTKWFHTHPTEEDIKSIMSKPKSVPTLSRSHSDVHLLHNSVRVKQRKQKRISLDHGVERLQKQNWFDGVDQFGTKRVSIIHESDEPVDTRIDLDLKNKGLEIFTSVSSENDQSNKDSDIPTIKINDRVSVENKLGDQNDEKTGSRDNIPASPENPNTKSPQIKRSLIERITGGIIGIDSSDFEAARSRTNSLRPDDTGLDAEMVNKLQADAYLKKISDGLIRLSPLRKREQKTKGATGTKTKFSKQISESSDISEQDKELVNEHIPKTVDFRKPVEFIVESKPSEGGVENAAFVEDEQHTLAVDGVSIISEGDSYRNQRTSTITNHSDNTINSTANTEQKIGTRKLVTSKARSESKPKSPKLKKKTKKKKEKVKDNSNSYIDFDNLSIDSDGFVEERSVNEDEFFDIEKYLVRRRGSKVPVNQSEDVSNIY